MDVNYIKVQTVLAKLRAKAHDSLGYIQYVFENIEEQSIYSKYIWCVRFPNWQCKDLVIDREGFLTFELHYAGIDKYFDGREFKYYNYTCNQFINFIDKPTKEEINETIIL